MSGFPIIDLVVGMIFIFFMLSIISSSAVEIVLTVLHARAKILQQWLFIIFDKTIRQPDGNTVKLGQAIMDHCSVTALSGAGKSTSYIDAKNFASALLEKITYSHDPLNVPKTIDDLTNAIQNTNVLSTEFQRVLLLYASEAKDTYQAIAEKTASEIDLFRAKIENWYDDSMDRLSDALKKKYSRPFTFWVALVVAVALNADSVSLAKYLYSNPEVRAKIALQADNSTKDSALLKLVNQWRLPIGSLPNDAVNFETIKQNVSNKIVDINKAKQILDDEMPLMWKRNNLKNADGRFSFLLLFSKITGLLATILAIMMGAPFWFDLLNKISNLRGTGSRPSTAQNEKNK